MKDIKINIIGASGTGKSTLAKAVADKIECAHFDSDYYFHYPTDPPFQKQRPPRDRLSLLMADLTQHRSWVLSGGAGVWDPPPPVQYSLVVFLYLPPTIRLERLRSRERYLYGSRVEAGGDLDTDHKEFMTWTAGYDDGTSTGTNTLPSHLSFLKVVAAPILRIESPMTTEEQVRLVVKKLGDCTDSSHGIQI